MVASAVQSELHSFNEASGRYIEMKEEFYEPTIWRRQSRSNKQASDGTLHQEEIEFDYSGCLEATHDLYKEMIKAGVAREQARIILPQALYTQFMWTASLQAIANFIKLRSAPHAQWEIQQYASAVHTIAKEMFPYSLATLLNPKPPTQEQLELLTKEQVHQLAIQHGIIGDIIVHGDLS